MKNVELEKALRSFEINGCGTLSATGADAVDEILPMIHGLASLLEMAFRKGRDGESAMQAVNPELVAAAFDGISHLAATALFHRDNQ